MTHLFAGATLVAVHALEALHPRPQLRLLVLGFLELRLESVEARFQLLLGLARLGLQVGQLSL